MIMFLYGVAGDVSISKLFIAGICPGLMLAGLFMGYIAIWAMLHPDKIPASGEKLGFTRKIYEPRNLIPVIILIAAVLGSIYAGVATATEAAAVGVVGALILAFDQGSMNWDMVKNGSTSCRARSGQYVEISELGGS